MGTLIDMGSFRARNLSRSKLSSRDWVDGAIHHLRQLELYLDQRDSRSGWQGNPPPDMGIWAIDCGDDGEELEIKKAMLEYQRSRGRPGGWAQEGIALRAATKVGRAVKIRIACGEYQSAPGYFTRYFVSDREVCITFSRKRTNSSVTTFLDHTDRVRISWKDLDAGKTLEFDTYLADYFLSRIGKNDERKCDTIVFRDVSCLNPLYFYDSLYELSEQYGFKP